MVMLVIPLADHRQPVGAAQARQVLEAAAPAHLRHLGAARRPPDAAGGIRVRAAGHNGSGFAGDGDPIFHQRFYQYSACSLFLLTLRLPPVKRWIAARQKEGRNWLVYLTIAPIFALFVFGFIFILNEEIFKGIDSFTEHPSAE